MLVVGSGQSGCQIAEELHLSGRDVFLSCGRAGWAPRRIGDEDIVWWLREAGSFDDRVEDLPKPGAGCGRTSRRAGTTAATTSTTGPSTRWA